MKLRNIFTMLAAALTLTFVGCEEPERFLDEVRVSKSYITFPVEGAEVKVDVEAVADWQIVALNDKFEDVDLPEWLTVSPVSGSKGKTEVVFTAGLTTESREVTLNLVCGQVRQQLKVTQVTEKQEAPLSTCNDVLTAGVVDQFYRIKGVVAEIPLADFQKYGKFYITDDSTTEKVQIYGCANKSAYLDGDKPKIDVGDIVVIEGSWSKYGNFNNDTQILEVEKSLIKVEKVSPVGPLAAEGDVFTVTLTNKGDAVNVSIPEADQAWLSYSEPFVAGTTAVIEFTAAANKATPRSTTITFSTTSGGVEYTASISMEQNGAIPEMTINQAVTSGEFCVVLGKVIFVNQRGVLVTDGTDVLYAYVGSAPEVKVDDIVKLTGTVTLYNRGRSMNKPTIELAEGTVGSYVKPSPIVLDAAKFAEYVAEKADFTTPYLTITGVAEVDNYGNIIVKLVDGETTYSIKSYYGNDSFAEWAGKKVQVSGYAYNSYSDTKQINLLVTSVKEPLETVPTVADVIAAGVQSDAMTEGVIVAKYSRGALISDGTGYILVYKNAAVSEVVGDKIQVSGPTSMYGGMLQFTKDCTLKKLSSGNTVTHPAVKVLDAAGMDAQLKATSVSYIEYVGTLAVSGSYFNVNIEGAATAIGSLQYIDDSAFGASALNGKKIKVRGYFIGVSSSKYVNTMTVSVEEVK